MKKLSLLLLFALAMVISTPCAHAQITEKQIKKDARKAEKRITKEGWTLYGSAEDLYSTLVNYYKNLQDEDAQGLIGVSSVLLDLPCQITTLCGCRTVAAAGLMANLWFI